MADNCKAVSLDFGSVYRKKGFLGLSGPSELEITGSLWNFTYKKGSDTEAYSGNNQPILGPDCRFTPAAYGCFAAPTGAGGPEGKTAYDYVTLKPGTDSFVYLDVGFWGGRKRDFGLVCGHNVWLCSFGSVGGAPEPDDPFAATLSGFQKAVGCFTVVSHAKVKLHEDDWNTFSSPIYLILPDMHMWPDPVELSRTRSDFFSQAEVDELKASLSEGKLVMKPDGSIDVPDLPPDHNPETPMDHGLRLFAAPGGRTAMKQNQLRDTAKMQAEETKHAFGTAGSDLVTLLSAVKRASQYKVSVFHIGDMFEMWAPVETCIDSLPFTRGSGPAGTGRDSPGWLQLSAVANYRIPKWLKLIYHNRNNNASLHAMEQVACRNIYGNHDVYLATGEWGSTGIPFIDNMKGSRAWCLETLLWLEHGHRFQINNTDGYWTMEQLFKPAGPMVTGVVNYYPGLRKLEDKFDNATENLFGKNLPFASLWYLLAHHAELQRNSQTHLFFRPPKFRIFCQGHTHSPTLIKVQLSWRKVSGSPPWVTDQPSKKAAGAGR